jgi:hypothetical protein
VSREHHRHDKKPRKRAKGVERDYSMQSDGPQHHRSPSKKQSTPATNETSSSDASELTHHGRSQEGNQCSAGSIDERGMSENALQVCRGTRGWMDVYMDTGFATSSWELQAIWAKAPANCFFHFTSLPLAHDGSAQVS